MECMLRVLAVVRPHCAAADAASSVVALPASLPISALHTDP